MLQNLSLDTLIAVTGGAGPAAKWAEIRAAAAPHCPDTVARFAQAPKNRAQAQAMGDTCLAEMGSLKAALGGRAKIQAGIDAAFPK